MNNEHSPTPWTEQTAILILAGDERVLLNGNPSKRDCRVLAEVNYQFAKHCVNTHANLLAVCRRLVEWMDANGYSPEDQSFGARAAIAKAE